MIKSLLSVGGFTILSRLTGLLRDTILSGVLGAAGLMDLFGFGFRLTNHFRAIFGEGAFNAAFVPTYARTMETLGAGEAQRFANQMLTLMFGSQLILLALAWGFMPQIIATLAPRFALEPQSYELAVTLTRITFPYLMFVTLVTLLTGALNAHRRFAAGAMAPVLLNVAMIACLFAVWAFPSAAHAAAVGVFLAGICEFALLLVAAARAGIAAEFYLPRWSGPIAVFFKAIVPAVIGSAGVQIAMLADSVIAASLPEGSLSAIYYADRIYQLPIGVIGIAAGTVLLPEMSRRIAAGDADGALHAQNRAMALTLALSAPFVVLFLLLPDLVMRGVFTHGRFSLADASAAGRVLAAYAWGLLAIVLIRSAVASFQARGDTRTPMFVSLAAAAVNVALKLALYSGFGVAGLAFSTAIGAWVNFGLLAALALWAGSMALDGALARIAAATVIACAPLAIFAWFAPSLAGAHFEPLGAWRHAAELASVGAAGALIYGLTLIAVLRLMGARLPARRGAALPEAGGPDTDNSI